MRKIYRYVCQVIRARVIKTNHAHSLNFLLTETFCNVLCQIDQLSKGTEGLGQKKSYRSTLVTHSLSKISGYATDHNVDDS